MKTLDEVIKANECCDHGEMDSRCEDCPYSGIGACCAERETDALHYLKHLQKIEDEYDELKDWWAEEHAENVPLTWDELKTMEGKPVWVEHDTPSAKYQRWVLVCEYTDSNKITIIANHLLTQIMPVDYGTAWQAYRKERK